MNDDDVRLGRLDPDDPGDGRVLGGGIIAIVFGIRYLPSGSASRGEIDEDAYRRRVAAMREHRAA